MKTVKTLLITNGAVDPRCLASVLSQTYPKHEVLISHKQPALASGNPVLYNYNIMEHRETARKMALASDADYFLFVDDDIQLPPDAVAEFVRQMQAEPMRLDEAVLKQLGAKQNTQKKHCLAGWIPVDDTKRVYVMGRFVDDHTVKTFTEVQPHLVEADVFGMGCFMVTRELLEKIDFRCRLDDPVKKVRDQYRILFVDECFTVADRIQSAGYRIYADGNVVCRHLSLRFATPVLTGWEKLKGAWRALNS